MSTLFSTKFIIVLAIVLLWGWESYFPFVPGRAHRLRHAFRNLSLGAIGAIVSAVLAALLLVSVAEWTAATQIGLLPLLKLPPLLATIFALLLLDGWMYLWHRANHELPFLWRFHRVHHSDTEMDVTSALRFHAGEMLLSGLLRAALIPVLGLSLAQILLYDALLLPVIFFHHSNINLPERIDRTLRLLVATPALHRVHHSRAIIEANNNYGSIFSWWDRLANTFRLRPDGARVAFGVEGLDEYQTLPDLLRTPFITASSAKADWSVAAPAAASQPKLR